MSAPTSPTLLSEADPAASCFFNALLRESQGWHLDTTMHGDLAILPVDDGELHLRLHHRSASGECRFQWPVLWLKDGTPRAVDFATALERILATPALVGELAAEARSIFRERVLESRTNTQASLDARDDLGHLQQGPLNFAEAEQGLLAGHAFHPAPKSRSPFSEAEAQAFCPEHRARFGLAWWALAPELRAGDTSRDARATELALGLLPEVLAEHLPDGFSVLPMHPWQAQRLHQLPWVQEQQRNGRLHWLGHSEPDWLPTSSHRSLYAPGVPWMVKGSLSARLTNSLRLLSVKEVQRGLHLDHWMRELNVAQRFPGFAVMQEPAWLGWRDANGAVDPASLVVLRENLLADAADSEAVVLATLTQQPLVAGGQSLLSARLRAKAHSLGMPLAQVARGWFTAFCERVLTPLFGLAVEDGIVLLAHQQNIVLRLDDGWPVGMFYRDCQGSGVGDRFLERHPQLEQPPENHWPPATLRRYFLYYLLINSTFAVTSALAADGLVDEATLLVDLRAHLEGLQERLDGDLDCLNHALNAHHLEAKGNFFCYLSGVNEATLAEPARLYLPLANPLATVRAASANTTHLQGVPA
ncbi:IucA/IucC family protein [Litchfieldella rifensis]|uniref:IucA/IucC family protein n=1 Tax=Litchfieldella rifensis TaxID=762643 RepID=A0ABV7LRJ5_9GAMM